jgi:hypothetical protein
MEHRLHASKGIGVVTVALDLADQGKSYREIALQLSDVTGVRITHETARSWVLEWQHSLGVGGEAA